MPNMIIFLSDFFQSFRILCLEHIYPLKKTRVSNDSNSNDSKNNFLRTWASDLPQIKNSLSLKSGKLRTNMHFPLK